MAEGGRGGSGLGRFFTLLSIVAIILGLSAVVLYLLSDINARRYRLVAVGNELVVEKGRFMPIGFERFVPDVEALREAYAPLEMPDGERLDSSEQFDDRADLDRFLYSLLAGWARDGMTSNDAEAVESAAHYIQRCGLLPGLSEQQRLDLKSLRGDLAYRNGRVMIQRADELLRRALDELRLSKELGTSRPTDVDSWIDAIERRVERGTRPPDAPGEGGRSGAPDSETPSPPPESLDAPLPGAPEREGQRAPEAPGDAPKAQPLGDAPEGDPRAPPNQPERGSEEPDKKWRL